VLFQHASRHNRSSVLVLLVEKVFCHFEEICEYLCSDKPFRRFDPAVINLVTNDAQDTDGIFAIIICGVSHFLVKLFVIAVRAPESRFYKGQPRGPKRSPPTGAAIATINDGLAALRRMFNLGKKDSKVRFVLPTISHTKENNVRKGFLDHNQYRELRSALPEYARSILVAMYYTGMRIGEVLAIQWDQVDIVEREIRLEPGTMKNGEARTLPLHGELLEVIQIQREIHDRKHSECQRVYSHGRKPIKNLYKAWRTACVKVGLGKIVCAACSGEMGEPGACAQCSSKAAKYVGLIPHDLPRTGARNLIRAGVPRSVAMRISRHKTESVFERYNIRRRRIFVKPRGA
jgi:integrase